MSNLSSLYIVDPPTRFAEGGYFPYSKALLKRYTLIDRFDEPYSLCKVDGDEIIIPRHLCKSIGDNDQRVTGFGVTLFGGKFIPRDKDQEKAVEKSTALLFNGENHILQAPTGSGKTYMGAAIISEMKKPTLIVVTKTDIVKQWQKALIDVCGLEKSQIGIIQADRCDVAGKPVAIGMVHSLCKKGRYPSWVYKYFGLVVVDEVHRMSAEQFSQFAWLFPSLHWLGLSATPYRKDGRDPIFLSHIGPVRVTIKKMPLIPRVLMKTTNWRLPTVVRRTSSGQYRRVPLPHSHGKTMHLSKLLCQDPERNSLIVKFVKKCFDKNRNTIIFSDIRAGYLDELRLLLIRAGIPKGSISMYLGGMKEKDRDKAKLSPVILTTYKMTSEATDIPWLDTAVLVHPKADVTQIVGRILREYPDKKTPVVLDLVDTASNVFCDYANSRSRWYRSIGATVDKR